MLNFLGKFIAMFTYTLGQANLVFLDLSGPIFCPFLYMHTPGHKSVASIPPERQGRVLRRDVHGMDSRIVSQLRIRQISVES